MDVNRATGIAVPALALFAAAVLILAVAIRWSGSGGPGVEGGLGPVKEAAEGVAAPLHGPEARRGLSGEGRKAVRRPKSPSSGPLSPSVSAPSPGQPVPQRLSGGPSFDHIDKEILQLWFSQLTELGCDNLTGPPDDADALIHFRCSCAILDMDDREYQTLECWHQFETTPSTAAEAKAALDAWLGSE
jgi:hypothetical protein